MSARYMGTPRVEFLRDGRDVKLIEGFSFCDPEGLLWPVPADSVVDGASIPRVFWTLIGGPFEGRYRDASIIHDYYCDVRVRTWQATHRVFYEAMVVSEVSRRTAKMMYCAVRWGGPRWSKRTTHNIELALNIEMALQDLEFARQRMLHKGFKQDEINYAISDSARKSNLARRLNYPYWSSEMIDDLVKVMDKGLPLTEVARMLTIGQLPHYWPPIRSLRLEAVPSPAQNMQRPPRLEDFAGILARIDSEDISLEEIDKIADHFVAPQIQ